AGVRCARDFRTACPRRTNHQHRSGSGQAGRLIQSTQYLTIAAKDFGSRLAPPTRAPSISSSAISDFAFSGLTEPPYRIRKLSANSLPKALAASPRTTRWAWEASCGVAVLPVPMAHTGSYATISFPAFLAEIEYKALLHWHGSMSSVSPVSCSSNT